MGSEEGETVEQAAAARRERLRALKEAQQLLQTPDGDNNNKPSEEDLDNNSNCDEKCNGIVKFRNYLPHDKHLQEGKLAPSELPKFEDPVAAEPPIQEKQEDPFLNIAPKKPNWDLRRDVQKKLDKLEKRTQKAIFQLMEEQEKKKLAQEGDGGDGSEN